MADPTIRDATLEDAPSIHAIYSHYCLHAVATFEETPPTVDVLAARMAAVKTQDLPYLVIVCDGRVTGYAYAAQYRAERTAYAHTVEASIYIQADCLRSGFGQLLMSQLLYRLRATSHVREVLAVVAEDPVGPSAGIDRFYEKNGFKRVGRLEDVGKKFNKFISVGFWQHHLRVE